MWYELKEPAIALRKDGMSIKAIENKLGIARSTLSGWFKDIELTDEQKLKHTMSSQAGLERARLSAAQSHRAQKNLRILKAKQEAMRVLDRIELTDDILDLALAMLYLGEGAKSGTTSIASSDSSILRFTLIVLKRNYSLDINKIRCDLHLRMDQNSDDIKNYWSNELGIPIGRFRYVAFDKRSEGKPTYDHYKGVCVITCGQIAIQRKLKYLYNLFCERVTLLNEGV